MNILQEIDSTLHYENLEKAWHKYKYAFMLTLVAIFAGVAGFNAYNSSVEKQSKNDTTVIFKVIMQKAQSNDYIQVIEKALEELETTAGVETLKLELAKTYKTEAKLAEYEKTLKELTSAKTQAVRHISTYMLAEHFLAIDAKKAIKFIDEAKVKKTAFTYALLQEIKAMALTKKGDKVAAKVIYNALIANSNLPANVQARAKMKLAQIK
ncbi:MAG TPA: hypothetical protein DCL21_05450 [Alphaproteobacteria bacterium]|nr:hypothetical protein [Alphaproteobacteria bacterium]